MKGVNKVILLGIVGADPEIKTTPKGINVASFSLATNDVYKDKKGEKITTTEWHKLTFWGAIVDSVIRLYVKKGNKVFVEGKIRYNKYEKDGKTTYFTDILCSNINLLSEKKDGNSSSDGNNYPDNNDTLDDDIPF